MLALFITFLFTILSVNSDAQDLSKVELTTNTMLFTSSITRDHIMQRTQVWIDEKVSYSQSATKGGCGYVSY